jgi:hypothetical protein
MRDARTAPDAHTVEQAIAVPKRYDITSKACRAIDQLEAKLVQYPQADCPVVHRFTPGLYSRECFTRAGLIFTSRIHLQDHQFLFSMGLVAIWCEGKGWVRMDSPYHGITPAGTRRVVLSLEDSIITTFHPTEETDLQKLEALLYLAHDGPTAAKALNP